MKIRHIALFGTLSVISCAAWANTDPVNQLLNNVGIYGEYAGITSAGESSSAGVGGRLETEWNGLVGSVDIGYTPGSLTADPHGSSTLINMKLGYGLSPVANVMVGPYLGYQYFGVNNTFDGTTLTDSNNAMGGGIFAAWAPNNTWGVQGNIGYLAGVSSSVSGDGYNLSGQAANLLNMSAEVDYRVSGPWSVFAGLHYDHYMEAGATMNLIRGEVGASLSF